MSNKMEFENQIMRLIFRHCDKYKVYISADAAWELAKKIGSISKLKTKDEIDYIIEDPTLDESFKY
jgi:hypothetical protein